MDLSPETIKLGMEIGGTLIFIGGALAGLRESLRLSKAGHRRMDDFEEHLTRTEIERAKNDGVVSTKIDNLISEVDRTRHAIHDTRNEIGGRLVRIEDRLDDLKDK